MFYRHGQSKFYLQQGLFNDLNCFSELEQRIQALPDNLNNKQHAFSVFVHAYLATQTLKYIRELWPQKSLPAQLQDRYDLVSSDETDIDGIFCNVMGEYEAYLCYFDDATPPKERCQRFIHKTQYRFRRRIIITNALQPAISIPIKDKKTCIINRQSFARLQTEDFNKIRRWLQNNTTSDETKVIVDFEVRILQATFECLQHNREATLVLPPGLNYAQLLLHLVGKLGRKTVVLITLAHSYAMQEMLYTWQQQGYQQLLSALVVDQTATLPMPTDFPVISDAGSLRQYLSCQFSGLRVIISNYKTLPFIAENWDGFPAIDLGLFCDIHGQTKNKHFTLSQLQDNAILRINGRIFITASEQHNDVSARNKQHHFPQIFNLPKQLQTDTMLRPLSVSEFINENQLRTCQIVVSLQDSIFSCLEQTFTEIPLQRLIIYCLEKEQASEYCEAVAISFPGLPLLNSQNCQNERQRQTLVRTFQESTSAVLIANHALLECASQLSVDWLILADSPPDFSTYCQLIGWITRPMLGNDCGALLIPWLITEQECTLESPYFSQIKSIVQVVREIDFKLNESIQVLNQQRGYADNIDYTRLSPHLKIIAPDPQWQPMILTSLIESIGDEWDYQYGALLQYRKIHDNCEHIVEQKSALAQWVLQQRKDKLANTIHAEHINKLNVLGFIWDPKEKNWQAMWQNLKQFIEDKGHHHVDKNEHPELARWTGQQRLNYGKDNLPHPHQKMLMDLGFIWDKADAEWAAYYVQLTHFQEENGHCEFSASYLKNNRLFSLWVKQQRAQADDMLEKKRDQLNELGFYWYADEAQWQRMFQCLTQFITEQGHCDVPIPNETDPEFGQWVKKQRKEKITAKLLPERYQKLNSLDFIWDANDFHWQAHYRQLKAYKSRFQHDHVPIDWQENPSLGVWVKQQRLGLKRECYNADYKSLLDALDFIYDPVEAEFYENYLELKIFHHTFQHCYVPKDWPENEKLRPFLEKCRKQFDKNKLSAALIMKLEALGVVLNMKQSLQNQMLVALGEFHCVQGHCDVPKHYQAVADLDWWIDVQRKKRKNGLLLPEFIDKLDQLDFKWTT